jgi:mRNA interferase MazF
MSYERGDVVLVVYRPPTAGPQRAVKSRPMVVVSSDTYHAERPQDVLAALVTTKVVKYQGQTDYALQDWQAAGLNQPSAVRTTLATVEHHQIGGKVGRLTLHDLQGVDTALRQALGL